MRIKPLPKQNEKAPSIKKEINTVEIQPGSQLKTTYPMKWVSTGLFLITAVTAGTGIAFLVKSVRKNDSYNNMMHIDQLKEYTETSGTVAEYTAKAETYREDSQKYRRLGWVSIGTAAASAVAGGLLFLFRKDISVKETGIVSFSTDGKSMFITYGREL